MSILSRWRGKLAIRRQLVKAARRRHVIHHTTDTAKVLKERKAQVAYALRVISRHSDQPLRIKALNHAEAALARHVFETGGNNRGKAVEEIITYAGGDVGEPWCVDFVIWCYGHAGSKVVRKGFTRAVAYMSGPSTTPTSSPDPGDIVRYSFDHTGIFKCWADANGHPTTQAKATHLLAIEGNTGASGAVSDGNGSDGVYEKLRARALVHDFLKVTA